MFQIIKPPIFEDENKTHQARLLNIILWALVLVPIPYAFYFVISNSSEATPALIQAAVGEAINIFLLVLLKRGHVRVAAIIQVMAFWLFFTIVAATSSGLRGPAYMLGNSLVIVIAGILLGGRGAFLMTTLVLFSGGIMLTAETQGRISFQEPSAAMSYWVISLILFPISALLQDLAARGVHQSLHSARASEARYRLLFEESPDGILIINENGLIVEINPAACDLIGYTPAEILGKSPEAFVDHEQPAHPFPVEEVIAGKTLARERVFIHKNGAHLSISGKVKQLPNGHYQFIFQDITERKTVEASVIQREAILQAVAFAAERFFVTPDWSNEIDFVLKWLGQVLKASHAYLFQNFRDDQGRLLSSMKYEWCAPGYPLELNDPIFQNNPVFAEGYEKSSEMFIRGQPYILSKTTDAQSEQEKEYLHSIGVMALVDIPIMVNGEWWGTLGFDDCAHARDWSNAEIDALKVAGNVVSAAIQRKLAESALRASKENYRLLVENHNDMVIKVDAEGRFLYVSPSYCQTFGKSESELLGKRYMPLAHEDDQARVTEALLSLASPPHTCYVEQRALTAQGWRWQAWNDTALLNDDGSIKEIIGVGRDITERVEADQALQSNLIRLEILHNIERAVRQAVQSPQATAQAAVDSLRSLVMCQRVSVSLFNYQSDHVFLLAVSSALPTNMLPGISMSLEAFGLPILEALREGNAYTVEDVTLRPSLPDTDAKLLQEGIRAWLYLPLIYQNELIGSLNMGNTSSDVFKEEWTETARDVANFLAIAIRQSQLFETIQQLNTNLEQRVRERTAQLETANRELESFSYSVSHDLRAPLRAIRGYSQIIMADHAAELSTQVQDYLNKVIVSALQMNELIEAMLVLAKMSRGELRKIDLDLTAMAHAIAATLSQNETSRSVTCLIAEGLSIYADEKLLNIVLQNLLGNAWKYTTRVAEARIEFGVQHLEGESVFFVRDNGIGFDMKYTEKLFGAFQRLHPVDEFPGHGIGLATVQRIIHRHGGRVWAEGKPNEGATFYFSIPMTDQE